MRQAKLACDARRLWADGADPDVAPVIVVVHRVIQAVYPACPSLADAIPLYHNR